MIKFEGHNKGSSECGNMVTKHRQDLGWELEQKANIKEMFVRCEWCLQLTYSDFLVLISELCRVHRAYVTC